jgi:hypothetical protein
VYTKLFLLLAALSFLSSLLLLLLLSLLLLLVVRLITSVAFPLELSLLITGATFPVVCRSAEPSAAAAVAPALPSFEKHHFLRIA